MQVSLEISMYPLTEDHLPVINAFLREMHASGLEVVTNGMSTQVFGPYDRVMEVTTNALRNGMIGPGKVAVTIKMLNDHLPPDRWYSNAWK